MSENTQKQIKYTGLNKLFRSDNMQKLFDSWHDGTFKEFVDDWKWIFSYSKKYRWIVIFYVIVGIFGSTVSIGTAYVGRIMINIITEKQTDKLRKENYRVWKEIYEREYQMPLEYTTIDMPDLDTLK